MEKSIRELRRRIRRWSIGLACCTVVSVILNLWHAMSIEGNPKLIQEACGVSAALCNQATELAIKIQGIHPVLGIIFAIVPPAAAFYLSDAMTDPDARRVLKVVIMTVFAIAMGTSILSQALVMRPYGGGYYAEWSIPIILDTTALTSLHMIIKLKTALRDLLEQVDIEADKAALRADILVDIQEDMERTFAAREADIRAAAALDTRRTLEVDIRRTFASAGVDMDPDTEVDILAGIQGVVDHLERTSEERLKEREERIRHELEVQYAAKMRLSSAPKKPSSGNGGSSAKAPEVPRRPAKSSINDLRALMAREPDMTNIDLATALGVAEKTIRRWKQQLEEMGASGVDMSVSEAVESALA